MRRTTSLLPLLLIVPFALAACGDDDESSAGAPPTDPAPAEDSVTVDIADFAFDPEELSVAAGTAIVWTNGDDFAHTAQADDGGFDTGTIEAGMSSEPVVLEEPGTYSYICGIHNAMTGTITVTG